METLGIFIIPQIMLTDVVVEELKLKVCLIFFNISIFNKKLPLPAKLSILDHHG